MIVVSLLDKSDRAKAELASFDDQFVRSQTGLGAEGAQALVAGHPHALAGFRLR